MVENRALTVLGLETSCDETAAAVVRRETNGRGHILSNVVRAQVEAHAAYAGVVPELAARAHVEALPPVVASALSVAKIRLDELDAIAVTAGPGLAGGLLAGLSHAKALALSAGKPFLAVNHLEGHALSAALDPGADYPFLLLLVSGGHSQILMVHEPGRYERWGTTIDDALGEAFDKTAKLLSLGFPGGPAVEKAAETGDPDRFLLPVPLKGDASLNFSFSGLKTALRQIAEGAAPLSDQDVTDLAAAFQKAACAALEDRLDQALARARQEVGDHPLRLVVAGGVAANRSVRAVLDDLCQRHDAEFFAPPLALCGDNGAMIAWAALERLARDPLAADGLDHGIRPRWPLDEQSEPMLGSGKRGRKA